MAKLPSTTLSAVLLNEDIKEKLISRDHDFLKILFSEVNPYLLRVCNANGFIKEYADDVIHDTWAVFFLI